MADNHVLFSECLSNLTRREAGWIRRVLSAADEDRLAGNGILLDEDEQALWPDFQWRLDGRELCIFSQENGNPRQVAQFVKAFLRRFRPGECWQMTWSETCCKPRAGEFGGGGLFVTAHRVCSFDAHRWVQQRVSAFAPKRSR